MIARFGAAALVLAAAASVWAATPGERVTAALESAPRSGLSTAQFQPDAPPTPAPAPSDAPAAARGNPLWAIPLRALAATRERPLFSPSRRPPPPPVAAEPAPPAPSLPIATKPEAPEAPPMALIGTIVSSEKRVAIFFNPATHRVTQVVEGAEQEGWTVRAVAARSAVVEKDDQSITLNLPAPGDAPNPPSAGGDTPTDAAPTDQPAADNGGQL